MLFWVAWLPYKGQTGQRFVDHCCSNNTDRLKQWWISYDPDVANFLIICPTRDKTSPPLLSHTLMTCTTMKLNEIRRDHWYWNWMWAYKRNCLHFSSTSYMLATYGQSSFCSLSILTPDHGLTSTCCPTRPELFCLLPKPNPNCFFKISEFRVFLSKLIPSRPLQIFWQ